MAKNNGQPNLKMVESQTLEIPKQELLSDTIRLAQEGLVKALKQANFLGRQIQLTPDTMVTTLEFMRQIAVGLEKLEGVEHEQIPEPPDPEPEPEPRSIIVSP